MLVVTESLSAALVETLKPVSAALVETLKTLGSLDARRCALDAWLTCNDDCGSILPDLPTRENEKSFDCKIRVASGAMEWPLVKLALTHDETALS